jgi:hypothetical protein
MYAFIVENDQGTWDVWNTLEDIPIAEKKERVENALESGLPIIGKDLTEFGLSARSGAVWDGTEWTGGTTVGRTAEMSLNLYSYICNDTIILMHISTPNTEQDQMMAAIFESENTMIKVPEGQTAVVGDIWDGTNIINQ